MIFAILCVNFVFFERYINKNKININSMKAKLVSESLNEHLNVVNEGVIGDIISKYSGKIKELVKTILAKLAPDQQKKLKNEIAPFKGMSLEQIKQELTSRHVASEGLGNKIYNFSGLAIFSTFVVSFSTILADDKWHFLYKTAFGRFIEDGVGGTGAISLAAILMWFVIKVFIVNDLNGPSYADDTRPSGTSSAERHSSAYIANQMRQRERNSGR